ncbi:MAG: tRNA(Met) cytidine acetyltransferase TmcA [Idiomarinaceae bacterium HL-53]|nr:MAG: tRNA(Met) cytidine acetyltransferase TmcA [Idiomarinaceae bacterium HL-53]CUS48449.1 tRNA(Met)-cytidine N(4)-acetyltransferase [Idiomarinaceae bacterium HL-53]
MSQPNRFVANSPSERLFEYYQRTAGAHHRALILWHPEHTPSSDIVRSALADKSALVIDEVTNYRQFLGTEQTILHFRFSHQWNANAWAACTGSVVGKGLVIVECTPELIRSPMWQHFLSHFDGYEYINCLQDQWLIDFLAKWKAPEILHLFLPTPAQARVLELLQEVLPKPEKRAVLLYAPRGRGKTATLAAWCGTLQSKQNAGYDVAISAPSRRQAKPMLDAFEASSVRFLAPGEIADYVASSSPRSVLIADEAASLPASTLSALLQHQGMLVLATTTEGYEFSGRGFQLKFEHRLKSKFPKTHREWLHLPVRWAPEDPLERATHHAFMLQSGNAPSIHNFQFTAGLLAPQIQYQTCKASELDKSLLRQAFALLVDAHYQTSPNDFKLLMDDPNQWLVTMTYDEQMVGVAWLSEEGPLISDLLGPITEGKRRPPGNLLPQTFCYYLKRPVLGSLRHIRVVRIAIHESCRRHGLGSALLARIHYWSRQRGADSVGTSFGATPNLVEFWHQNGYFPLRLGHKTDPASGHASAIFIFPLEKRMQIFARELASLFLTELFARLSLPHQQTQAKVIEKLISAIPFQERPEAAKIRRWHEFGEAFIAGELNFLDYTPWLRLALLHGWLRTEPSLKQLLTRSAQANSAQELAHILGAQGKQNAVKKLQEICADFHHSDR